MTPFGRLSTVRQSEMQSAVNRGQSQRTLKLERVLRQIEAKNKKGGKS